jgi:hypothetical protein
MTENKKQEVLDEANKWTTAKVNALMERIEEGSDIKNTPFWDGKPEWRAANIVFEYTPEELVERFFKSTSSWQVCYI